MKHGLVPGDEWEDVMLPLLVKLNPIPATMDAVDLTITKFEQGIERAPDPVSTAIIQHVTGEWVPFGPYVALLHNAAIDRIFPILGID